MAGYDLIDSYLEAVRTRLRWHGQTDDIGAELRDHLYTAAEQLEADGLTRLDAQHAVLDRFGEPGVVSSSFAANGTTGLAIPTHFTTSMGTVAIIAALGWLAVAVGFSSSYVAERSTREWEGIPQLFYLVGQASLLAAAALTVGTFVGLARRHGGLGVVGRLGIGVVGIGVAATMVGWFYYGWGALIAAGSVLIGTAVLRRGLAPTVPILLLGTAWLLAGGIGIPLQLLEVGPRDQWGDYPLASVIGISIGCVAFAAGLAGIGRWLRHEDPVGPLLDPAPDREGL